ncbi:hypothetical protein LA080_006286 [Diaporthe eres]|nr:hypothetical protein LA080_006286 [Diaporthe eres]
MDGEEPGWNLRPLEYIHINTQKSPGTSPAQSVNGAHRPTVSTFTQASTYIYGTDNSLAEGYHGYRRVLKEEERHPMKPASKSSKTSSGRPRLITAIAPEDHQSRDVRTALLRAASMKSVLPPEGTPALDELRPLLAQGDTAQFDDLRRALVGDDPENSQTIP